MTAVPPLRGIHHVKVAVSELDRAADYYARALGARRIAAFAHVRDDGSVYAAVLEVLGLGALLELRVNPEQAARHRGFDAITIAVDDRTALTGWADHLDAAGLPHSRMIRALQAWLVVAEDPDGNRFRLYTLEQHDDSEPVDTDPWLEA